MPHKALVAFGTVLSFGLLIIALPAWCFAADILEPKISPTEATDPQYHQEQTVTATETAPLLTLDDAISRSIAQNPRLATFSREIEAREFETLQAGYYPNPELSIEMENFAGSDDYSGTDLAETTVLVSQRFELGGKRVRRQEVGGLNKELAERKHDVARAELIALTTDRFVAVLAAQQRLELAREQATLAGKVLETVNERIAAGKTADIEKIRFQTLVAEARLRSEQTQLELTGARRSLAALWGQDTTDFTTSREQLERLHSLPDWPELAALLVQSPALSYQQTTIRKEERRLALEEANSIPDLTVSLGAKNFEETNDNALVAGVAISLPLFDRNQGAIGAAQARQAKARDAARATELNLQTELNGLWQKLQTARGEAIMLRDELLPAVQQSFDAITYGYRAGKFGFLAVLDAEQTLFAAKSRYVDSLANYHRTYAELERLLGQRLLSGRDNPPAAIDSQRGQS
jgi:cobalt-zinc-cadmium efflux system outer membrane protein